MMSKALILLFVPFLLISVAGAGDLGELTNYREYSPTLSSSGQPSAEQLDAIKDAGFSRVVFLALTDSNGSIANEDSLVEKLGMEFVHVPVVWESPTLHDFKSFAGAMQAAADMKTLVHCQVNFRASTFSFLYRVLYEDVPMGEAKEDLDSVWIPTETWQAFIFDVLEEYGRSPDCDTCLWESH